MLYQTSTLTSLLTATMHTTAQTLWKVIHQSFFVAATQVRTQSATVCYKYYGMECTCYIQLLNSTVWF